MSILPAPVVLTPESLDTAPRHRSWSAVVLLATLSVVMLVMLGAHSAMAQSRFGAGAGGPGSISLSVSATNVHTGHLNATVTCSTGRRYVASVSATTTAGNVVSADVTVADYLSAGTYSGTVSASDVSSAGTQLYRISRSAIPMTITSTGGSVTYHTSGTHGHPVSLTVTWACSSPSDTPSS